MAVVPILTYHSIDESGSPVAVSREQFLRQMSFLAGRGFSVIPLSTLCRQWSTGGELPARPVVLTFDDGYRNTLVDGVPVLTRFGFTATIFVVSAYVGAMNDWPTQPSWVPRLPLLEWDELRELSRQGFEIGSHTETHARLRGLPADRQDREIVGSRQTLEDRLGTAVNSLAYPYGEWDDCSRRLASAQYEIACGTRLRSGKPPDDLLDLPRIDACYLRPAGVFKLLATPRDPFIWLSGGWGDGRVEPSTADRKRWTGTELRYAEPTCGPAIGSCRL